MGVKSIIFTVPWTVPGMCPGKQRSWILQFCIPQMVSVAWLPISITVATAVCEEDHQQLSSVYLLDITSFYSDSNGFPLGS